MVKKITNREIPEYVRRKQKFCNNNETAFGGWFSSGYAVHSYNLSWPIAIWDRQTETWYTHDDKISYTTSRHTGLTLQGIGDDYILLPSVRDLIAVLTHGYTRAVAHKLTQHEGVTT